MALLYDVTTGDVFPDTERSQHPANDQIITLSDFLHSANLTNPPAVTPPPESWGSILVQALPLIGAAVADPILSSLDKSQQEISVVSQDISSSVGADIQNAINGASSTFSSIFAAITGGLSDVTHFLDTYVNPITDTISKLVTLAEGAYSAVVGDLTQGITGLLKIPQDVTSSLTSIEAQIQRTLEQYGETQGNIVKATLVPGLSTGIGGPVSDVHASILAGFVTPPEPAAITEKLPLDQPLTRDDVGEAFDRLKAKVGNHFPIVSDLITVFLDVLQAGPILVGGGLQLLENAKILAQELLPITRLDVGVVLEAWRRQYVTDAALDEELSTKGYDPDRRVILRELARFLPGIDLVTEWLGRGYITPDDAAVLYRQHGMSTIQADLAARLAVHVPPFIEVGEWWLRGQASEDDVRAVLKLLHYTDAQADAAIATILRPPELSLAVAARGRELAGGGNLLGGGWAASPPQELIDLARQNDRSPDDVQRLWLQHWHWLDVFSILQAYYRNLINETTAKLLLQAQNVPDELWPVLIDLERPLIPIWEAIPMMTGGFISDSQGRAIFAKLGYAPDDIDALIAFAHAKNATSQNKTALDLQGATASLGKTLYTDGAIDQAGYTQILAALGYGTDTITLTIELADLEREKSNRDALVTYLVEQIKLGLVTIQDAQTQLYQQNFTTPEVLAAIVKFEQAAFKTPKVPTEAEAKSMYLKGILSPTDYYQYLIEQGYSDTWAQRLIQLAGPPPTTGAA